MTHIGVQAYEGLIEVGRCKTSHYRGGHTGLKLDVKDGSGKGGQARSRAGPSPVRLAPDARPASDVVVTDSNILLLKRPSKIKTVAAWYSVF